MKTRILGRTLLLLTLTSAACASVRYTVRGREIVVANPTGSKVTLRTDDGIRQERIELVSLDTWGPEWSPNLPRERAQWLAQARAHPDRQFILESTRRSAGPALCGLAGLFVGSIVGGAVRARSVSDEPSQGLGSIGQGIGDVVGGVFLGGLGGLALAWVACAVGRSPTPAHLVPEP